jgi:signal transduction histidine kinase
MVGHNGFEYLHPDDYAPGQELFGRLFQPHPEPVTTELRYKCKGDTWAWVQATGTNLLAEPSVKAIVINYHDITDRKRADQELRARNRELSVLYAISSHATQSLNFEQALDATLATTLAALDVEAGGIYLWEPGAPVLKLQAYHGPDELRHMVDRIHPGQSLPGRMVNVREPLVMNIDDFPVDQIPAHVLQTGFRSMVTVPLVSGGSLSGALIVGTHRDRAFPPADLKMLTAIGRQLGGDIQATRTRELAAANERLQELDRLKSKFVSDVSHELRTPITALSLNVDLLEHGKPEKREQYLQAIRQQVKREVQLLEDILNLSRLELGSDKVQFAPVVLNALIAQVVAVHQSAADARNLTLTFTPYSELPVVPGEENQLAQVITNLIGNAINYTPAGEIRVSTGLQDHNVLIEVRDTGLGIAPEDLSHLFERFYRGRRTRDIRGTGLGLAIVKEIVDLHDGRIEVDSEPGGTTFRVYLPLTPRPSAVEKTNEPA